MMAALLVSALEAMMLTEDLIHCRIGLGTFVDPREQVGPPSERAAALV